MNKLEDLLYHQLKDIYSAETQLIRALSRIEEKASDHELKNALSNQLIQTKMHKERLEGIARNLGINLEGGTCEVMLGLIKEATSKIDKNISNNIKDAALMANCQHIGQYVISSYSTAVQYAKALKYDDVAVVLQQTLDNESDTNALLNILAIENINKQALSKAAKSV